MVTFDLDSDVKKAADNFRENIEAIEDAGAETIDQLATLAEGSMKQEAPEGVGLPSVHMRDTIRPEKSEGGMKATIRPHKRTREGWLLHHAVVGNPSVPEYGDEPPPVWSDGSGEAQGPLARWAGAKLGDPDIAWRLQHSIQNDGHRTFPNKFIDRSVRDWRGRVEDIAESALEAELE